MPPPKIIEGNSKPNGLNGTDGVDYMYGYGGNDWLTGLGGSDILDGGEGADTMKGGRGDDEYYVDNAGDTVVELKDEGRDIVHTTVTYGLSANVEALIMQGNDNIDGFGNGLDNDIYGNSGDNSIWGGGGNDTIHGGFGNDHLYGNTGDDTLLGGPGADVMRGGLDNDTYYVDGISDQVIEGSDEGWDTVHSTTSRVLEANVEALVLEGSANIDGAGNELENVLTGNSGNNMLFGYGGADTLDGGAGSDTLFGGDGDDIYYVEGDLDTVIEHNNQGIDWVYSSGFITTLSNNVEILQLTGNAVMGFGNILGNTIVGTDGANYIDGRGGADNLSGGGGRDTFVFRAGEANGDAIYDFNGNGAALGDVMEFQGYGPGATFQQVSATEWQISSADGSIHDTIVLINGATVDASDWHFT